MIRSHAEGRTVTTLLELVSQLSDLLGEEGRVNDAVIRLIREGRLRTPSGRTLALASRERASISCRPAVAPGHADDEA